MGNISREKLRDKALITTGVVVVMQVTSDLNIAMEILYIGAKNSRYKCARKGETFRGKVIH